MTQDEIFKHKLIAVLTKEEIAHLMVDGGITSEASAARTFRSQAQDRKKGYSEPCWDCKCIAVKLGYSV